MLARLDSNFATFHYPTFQLSKRFPDLDVEVEVALRGERYVGPEVKTLDGVDHEAYACPGGGAQLADLEVAHARGYRPRTGETDQSPGTVPDVESVLGLRRDV